MLPDGLGWLAWNVEPGAGAGLFHRNVNWPVSGWVDQAGTMANDRLVQVAGNHDAELCTASGKRSVQLFGLKKPEDVGDRLTCQAGCVPVDLARVDSHAQLNQVVSIRVAESGDVDRDQVAVQRPQRRRCRVAAGRVQTGHWISFSFEPRRRARGCRQRALAVVGNGAGCNAPAARLDVAPIPITPDESVGNRRAFMSWAVR